MRRREFLRVTGLTAASALLPPVAAAAAPAKRPNILFVMSDDHTSQTVGAYGLRLSDVAPTRNIDRLAAEGALLSNCFCTNSICVK